MRKYIDASRLAQVSEVLWGLVLLTLPVTSFRYFPAFMGKTTVQPLALYPLVLLLPLLAWQVWQARCEHNDRWRVPQQLAPLLIFILFALLATVLGAYLAPLPLRGQEYVSRAVRAWASLGIGLSFFAAAILMTPNEQTLRRALRWLYIGLFLSIIWGLVQAIAINTPLLNADQVREWQTLFSLRPTVKRRISGFAFEPSWLADQMVILYLPWLAAALMTGYAALRRRWLEALLLLGALALLLLTYSRGGIINLVIAVAAVFLLTGGRTLLRLGRWFVRPFSGRAWVNIAGRVALLIVLVAVLFGTVVWLSQYQYFANLWEYDFSRGFVEYFVNNNAGPRLANAFAGFDVFTRSPWSGVGLGASGFYLFDAYPDWAMIEQPELSRLLSPDSKLFPNPKNLYIRLLAETGLPGFWLFMAFMFSVLGAVRQLARQQTKFGRFASTAGLFIWFTITFRSSTQDSLTFPVMWVSLGMIVGLAALNASKHQSPDQGTENS